MDLERIQEVCIYCSITVQVDVQKMAPLKIQCPECDRIIFERVGTGVVAEVRPAKKEVKIAAQATVAAAQGKVGAPDDWIGKRVELTDVQREKARRMLDW